MGARVSTLYQQTVNHCKVHKSHESLLAAISSWAKYITSSTAYKHLHFGSVAPLK